MAKAYSDDLRRKLIEAHQQGEGSLEVEARHMAAMTSLRLLAVLNVRVQVRSARAKRLAPRPGKVDFLRRKQCGYGNDPPLRARAARPPRAGRSAGEALANVEPIRRSGWVGAMTIEALSRTSPRRVVRNAAALSATLLARLQPHRSVLGAGQATSAQRQGPLAGRARNMPCRRPRCCDSAPHASLLPPLRL